MKMHHFKLPGSYRPEENYLKRFLPIEIVDEDIQIAREAARFKATKKISYADCFAADLAKPNRGEVITGDKEFKLLEDDVKINWIL